MRDDSDPYNSRDPWQDYICKMNRIFQHVDKNKIATGLLSDYGLQMVDPTCFNGIPADSNYVSIDTINFIKIEPV